MAHAARSSTRPVSTATVVQPLAGICKKLIAITAAACFFVSASVAQEPSVQRAPEPAVTIPAGTQFVLVLTNPVSSRTVHRGDDVHAQLTAPIAFGDQVVIPAGTFIQGKVDKLRRDGSRADINLQSASIIFPDGYVATIAGPLTIVSDEGTAWADPGSGTRAGAILAPLAGVGIGTAIGAAAHTTRTINFNGQTITQSTPKGIAIGSVVGLAAGAVISIALLVHSRQFYVDSGAPIQMTLPQGLTLAQNRVTDAVREASQHPPAITMPVVTPASTTAINHGTCFTPGTPSTPPTVIPGVPGANGVPGPPTILPGTPGTPSVPYPCP